MTGQPTSLPEEGVNDVAEQECRLRKDLQVGFGHQPSFSNMAQNGCYLIQKPTVRDATMNDRFVADFRRLRGQGPKSTAGSTGRRNTSFKSLCRCFEV